MKLFVPPQLTGKFLSPTLQSGWLTSGPRCQELKATLATFLQVKAECVVLAGSCTAAWQSLLDMLIKRHGPLSVRMTPATFVGMRHVVDLTKGAYWEQNGNADLHVRVDIGGRRDDDAGWALDAIRIRDAAHSWIVDPEARFSLMSMYPTKLVPGPGGGVVVCASEADAAELEYHTYVGLRPGMAGNGDVPQCIGRKAEMNDVSAALALEALELAPNYIAAIEDSWRLLAGAALRCGVPLRAQPLRPYLAQLECPPTRVPSMRACLGRAGIPTAHAFPPAGLVVLPCYPNMTPDEARFVIEECARVL